jgi:magnesium transporter
VLTIHRSGDKTVWVDLCEPTPEELAKACSDYGLEIPPRAELEEIEFSSRLQHEDGVITLSVPVTPHTKDGDDITSPLGFVLTKDLLVTIRFAHLHTFSAIIKRVERRQRCAPDIFLVILEAIVDYSADRLEELGAETKAISTSIFRKQPANVRHNVARTNKMLKNMLVQIGNMSERLSYIRDTLLVLQRAVPFVTEHGDGWMEDAVKARLKMAGSDVQSLNDYEVHLTDKIQFLLDAALGFINTEQNDLFKVLTIASVVGIPPTFVASMYGMNFHNMPELTWAYGYQWGLFLIVLSTVLPIAWFKHRGWW